jgi:hypothetical protein
MTRRYPDDMGRGRSDPYKLPQQSKKRLTPTQTRGEGVLLEGDQRGGSHSKGRGSRWNAITTVGGRAGTGGNALSESATTSICGGSWLGAPGGLATE